MAVKLGMFSARSTAGSQSVTGLGFTPVAVMFFSIEGNQANPSNFFAAATGSSEQFCMWTGMDDQASGYTRRYHELRDDKCIYILASPNFTSEQCAASFTSLDADGFTVNFSTGGNSEFIVYMAIGGNHITAAHAGTFTLGSGTGTTAITAPGFLPNALVTAWGKGAAANTSLVPDMAWGMGVGDGSNQYATFAMGDQGGTGTVGYSIHRTDGIAVIYDGTGPDAYLAHLDSFDANGFTIDVSNAWTANVVHGYLAIQADEAVAGNGVQPDSTGTQTFSTPDLEPGGVLFCWNGVDIPATGGTDLMPVRPGVGAMDGISGFNDPAAAAISLIHRASAPFGAYVPDAYWDTLAINIRGQGSQVDPDPHACQGCADFSAFAMGSFTIDWTTVTGGADRAFGWLALPGEIPAPWIPQIYRRVHG